LLLTDIQIFPKHIWILHRKRLYCKSKLLIHLLDTFDIRWNLFWLWWIFY